MRFDIDNQILEDLNVFPERKKAKSVFDIFKNTITSGGQRSLISIMKNPTNEINVLSKRINAIEFIQHDKYKNK